ncbi:SRPBCC family protein [Streptomyces bambusae]|uniref:SRPBCC family protein n=1 Tax=Streptomyces bambusae TaxID=1550616 RepID=UPI001CFE2A98|nr:SRPBCC family protein [Streptomyces bambusae]MCB5165355.1 SRPBCC family protein [Streptomyces bambusae]
MDWSRYRFRSVWDLAAPPDRVFAVLAAADRYPDWWPQVRRVVPHGEDGGTAVFRSLLPYELHVTATGQRRDPAAGVLEAALHGDLEGWVRWTLRPDGHGGTRARYEQEVTVRKPLMRRLAVPGRPLFRLNHALMMRSGRRGLQALLAAREPPPGGRPRNAV